MGFGIRFACGDWRDIAAAAFALGYIGGFVLAIEYALRRLHFLSGF